MVAHSASRTKSVQLSEVELHGELNQPRIIARLCNETEITGMADNLSCILINAGGGNSVEAADRIGEVYVIEEIKELCAKFNCL